MGLEDTGPIGPEGRARPAPPTLATTWAWRFGRASKSKGADCGKMHHREQSVVCIFRALHDGIFYVAR